MLMEKEVLKNQDTAITRVFGNLVKTMVLTNDLSLYALAGLELNSSITK